MTREEAIEILRNNVCNSHHVYDNVLSTIIEALAVLVPELRENEDERIRKEIDTLYSEIDTCISELLKARTDKDSKAEGKALFKMEGLMVATLQDLSCIEDYLEKQKEQKSAEKHDLVAKLKEHLANTPKEQLEAEWKELEKWNHVGPTVEEYLCGIKPAECEDCAMYLSGNCIHPNGKCENVKSKPEWSEEDESCWNLIWDILDGPFTASKEGYKKAAAWFLTNCPKGTKSLRPQPKQDWSEEDKEALDMCLDAIPKRWKTKSGILLTKWLKDNIHLQPKQEWSEEDEDNLHRVIRVLEDNDSDWKELSAWLKYLRPQPKRDCKDCAMFLNGKCTKPHWKPSDEQMGALWKIMKYAVSLSSYYNIQKEIESLYNDLNKLK